MSNNSKTEKAKAASIGNDAKFHEEDGWIFRERPGVPVECLHRAGEERIAPMTPPNQIRHNYPSA